MAANAATLLLLFCDGMLLPAYVAWQAVDSAVQGPVLEVLGGLRAARAALELQEAEQASQKIR